MNVNEFLDMAHFYAQQIREANKKIEEEQKRLRTITSKYNELNAHAYKEGLFKISLGKLKEVVASYNNIPVSQINLTLEGVAKLFFSPGPKNYRKLVSSLRRYPNKVKIKIDITSQTNNLKISLSPVDFCDFLIENEKLFSTNGSLNDNLQFNLFTLDDNSQFINDFSNRDIYTILSFAPKCLEEVVVNIHPKQLDMDGNYECLKPSLYNYLEKKPEDKEL